jgi:putative glutamine amidotransferase
MNSPVIGITPDITDGKLTVSRAYLGAVVAHNAVPVVLACEPALIPNYLALCDGFIFTGGDDPDMSAFGLATHPKAKPMHPARQSFELLLFQALEAHPDVPVLGICLGMQLMGLHAGGTLNQHLPDSLPSASDHSNRSEHRIHGDLGSGVIHSHHRQALESPGSLAIVARSHDGVIEAIRDPQREFYLGVQWHPERTIDNQLGSQLFRQLVESASAFRRGRQSRIAGSVSKVDV